MILPWPQKNSWLHQLRPLRHLFHIVELTMKDPCLVILRRQLCGKLAKIREMISHHHHLHQLPR